MKASIFISYASQDRFHAEKIIAFIEAQRFRCWAAFRDVHVGANYQESITHTIRNAKIMIAVFTDNSNSSSEMPKELSLASRYNLKVIPLRMEDAEPGDALAYELATHQWVDMFQNWEAGCERVLSQLKAFVPTPLRGRTPPPPRPAAEIATPPTAAPQPAAPVRQNSMNEAAADRVLIVDDDAAIRQTLTMIAQAAGFAARAAADAAGFREMLASWRPAVIILDLQMPGCDGIEVLVELGRRNCTAQVIIASGADSRTLDAAMRIGREHGLQMVGHLQKPFELDGVGALLRRAMAPPAPSQAELAEAIAAGQLFLEYQPKLDCQSRRITGVEALVRWNHPVRGRLVPDQFIPLAEESGLIERLTDWVFDAAVRQAAAWHGAGWRLDVALNISARDIDSPDLPDRLARRCGTLAVDLERIILEVSETSAMRDPLRSLEVLTRLRVKGFRLSMDDFGTAYSSLVQLQRMPFCEIKIDRSFVTSMLHDNSSRVIAAIIVDLARNLGMRSIAEGVESEELWNRLCAIGCDGGQGYHFSRPVTADRVAALLDENGRAAAARAARR
ncbi:MAG TPA: EAL domain-containing protein [Stellaceae bacterium]|nr:EAL domain-containing protein [Stellaceae bacterium]